MQRLKSPHESLQPQSVFLETSIAKLFLVTDFGIVLKFLATPSTGTAMVFSSSTLSIAKLYLATGFLDITGTWSHGTFFTFKPVDCKAIFNDRFWDLFSNFDQTIYSYSHGVIAFHFPMGCSLL
jgi:hypothetical protein